MVWKLSLALGVILLQVTVPPIIEAQTLKLQGGPVLFELDPIGAPVGFDSSSRLRWNRVRGPSKIMVSSFTADQRFDLYVEALDARRGSSLGEVQLISGEPAQDFLIGVDQRGAGQCTLGYRAEIRAEQGYGTQIQTVTYTITSL